MKAGPLIIVSGPSGSGKSTLVEAVLHRTKWPLRRSISSTTRPKRPGEIEGEHYHYWTRQRFEDAISAGEMLEWAIVHKVDYYGTPKAEVEPFRDRGVGVILVIDVQGAGQIRRQQPGAYAVFLTAPTGEYERRIRQRGESDEAVARRMASARDEIARANEFDETIINDILESAADRFEASLDKLFLK
jgi:guanylate kinase